MAICPSNIHNKPALDPHYRARAPDMAIVTIDYGAMDADKLQQLQKDADTKHFVGLSKKKRKQLLKKKSKFLLKKAKGLVNMGFIKDDEDMRSILSVDDEDDHSHISRIKIYPNELEKDFDGFNWIETFRLFRGKQLDEEDDSIRLTGKFKGTMSIYELKDEIVDLNDNGTPVISQSSKPQLRLMKQVPTNNKPFKVQVNIYIVQAINLHPVDFNGKADPYVVISCGRSKINDKANRFNNQLNPVFGKLYQFDVIFPLDSMLKICIMDYDALSSDDLIGETYIDLEDRMFSQHRAICGLHQNYELLADSLLATLKQLIYLKTTKQPTYLEITNLPTLKQLIYLS